MGRYLKVSAFKEQMYRVPGDFLGPFMQTFDDRSHVLTFVYLYELQCSCGKLAQNSSKWQKITKGCPKLLNMPILGNVGLFWLILGKFGLFWVILGNIRFFLCDLSLFGAIFPQLHCSSY